MSYEDLQRDMKAAVAKGSSSHVETPHPGRLLRDHVLPGLTLSVSQAARDLGISRQTLHRILDGSTAITPEMATRLGVLAGLPPIFWLRIQCEYDLQRAHVSLADALRRIPRHTLPHQIMKDLGALDGR